MNTQRKRRPQPVKKYKPAKPLDYAAAVAFVGGADEVGEIVHGVIELIVQRGMDLVMQHYVAEFAKQSAADASVKHAVEAMTVLSVSHGAFKEHGSWLLEEEPSCAVIDRFARGAVRTKSRMSLDLSGLDDDLGAAAADTDPMSTRSAKASARKKKPPEAKAVPLEVVKTEAQIQRDALRDEGIRRMEKKKKAESDRLQKEEELEAEQNKLREIENKLKGQDYTFDSDGKVVMISHPKPDRMPAMATTPEVALVTADGDEQTNGRKVVKRDSKKGSKKRGSSKKRRSKKRVGQPPSVPFQQSNIVDATTVMKPAGGVTIKTAGSSRGKTGQTRNSGDMRKMTREEYNNYVQAGQRPSRNKQLTPVPPNSVPPSKGAPLNDRDSLGDSQNSSRGSVSDNQREAKEGGGDRKSTIDAYGANPGRSEEKVGNNYLEGGDDDPSQDPLWGRNSPVNEAESKEHRRPRPPTVDKHMIDKQKAAGLGFRARQPRQRPFIETSKERKRLPPPLYPANIGHGTGGPFTPMGSDRDIHRDIHLPAIPLNGSAMESQSHDFLESSGDYGDGSYRKTWAKDDDNSTITVTDAGRRYMR